MKKRYVIGMLMLLSPLVADAYTISGTVSGGGGVRIAAAVPVELDTFYVGLVLFGFYSIDVPGGNYIVAAFQDENINGEIDPGEPVGWWGGDFPEVLVVTGNVSGISIQLSDADGGSFSGLLTYNGELTGASFVRVFDNPELTGLPFGGGLMFQNDTGNGIYMGMTTSQGTFYADAFLDMNGNLEPDPDEAYGIYGGETPAPFVVTSTEYPSDVDIVLLDPRMEVEDLTVSISGSDAVLRWTFPGAPVQLLIYRSTDPAIDPLDATLIHHTTTDIEYTDSGILGSADYVLYRIESVP